MENSKLDNILKEYKNSKKKHETCGNKIQGLLRELLDAKEIEYHEVTCRIKDEESLIKKIKGKDKYNNKYNKLADITDIIGLRVITYYSDDIDKVAKLIEENFEVDEKNSIDKRKVLEPEKFGYLSLHYIAKLNKERLKFPEYKSCKNYKFEIQIRSILQHAWAEIEHDLGYKNDIKTPRDIRRDFSRLAGLLEIADKEFVNIRNQISEYKDSIEKKIKKKEETIYIDKISMEAYINDDIEYNKLITKIHKNLNININEEISLSLSDLQFLIYMGYETINQVKDGICQNKEKIYSIAKEILSGYTDVLPKSALLLYLCYAKLSESQSLIEFLRFFDENDIIFEEDDEESQEEFAYRIINACEIEK